MSDSGVGVRKSISNTSLRTAPICESLMRSTRVFIRDSGVAEDMMSSGAAVVVGLGVVLMLLTQSADPHLTREDPAGLRAASQRLVLCVVAGVSVVAAGWMYRLLFHPLELLRAPEDVGYIAEGGRSKAQAANDARRRRKVGDLPPVYPNGWYRVLDSHSLSRGEVRNVSILGMTSFKKFFF